MKNILSCIFGSSIMEGRMGVEKPRERWYNLLQRELSRQHPDTCFPIVNSAVGGESTREIMGRFDRDILPYNPDFCLFMVGGNNHDCRNPRRILAEGELQSLMNDFTTRLPEKTRPIGVVLNPVVDDWHFTTRDPAYREYLADFGGSLDASLNPEREQARDFYITHNWPVLDLYHRMSGNPRRYVLPGDGIHLNPAGHRLFAREMFKILAGLL